MVEPPNGGSAAEAATGGGGPSLRQRLQAAQAAAGAAAGGEAADTEAEGTAGRHDHRRQSRASEACRRFFSSRVFKCSVLAVVGVVPVYGIVGFLPIALRARGCTGLACQLRHYLLATWISVQFLYNFAMSQFTDPGGCLHIKPTYEATGQFEMALGSEDSSGDALLYAPNFCEHCRHWKPPRAHHCSICRRCVLRMDHHCPFTGNCIGMRNQGHFILMYAFAFLGLTYSLLCCASAIFSGPRRGDGLMQLGMLKKHHMLTGVSGMVTSLVLQVFVHAGLEVALQSIFTTVALVAVLSFGSPALYLACTGQTLLEAQFPMKDYVQIKPQVFCPLGPGFYRWGWRQNLRDVLGAQWPRRLLLPVRGGGLDPRVALAPRPSPEGAAALLARVKQVEEQGVQQEVRSCQELGINPGPPASASGNVV